MQKINQPKRIMTDVTIRMILCIGYEGKSNTFSLAKSVGITHAHAYKKIMPKLTAWGCIEIGEKEGRQRIVTLTPKGIQIFKRLQEIGELLGEPGNETRDRRLDLIIDES